MGNKESAEHFGLSSQEEHRLIRLLAWCCTSVISFCAPWSESLQFRPCYACWSVHLIPSNTGTHRSYMTFSAVVNCTTGTSKEISISILTKKRIAPSCFLCFLLSSLLQSSQYNHPCLTINWIFQWHLKLLLAKWEVILLLKAKQNCWASPRSNWIKKTRWWMKRLVLRGKTMPVYRNSA